MRTLDEVILLSFSLPDEVTTTTPENFPSIYQEKGPAPPPVTREDTITKHPPTPSPTTIVPEVPKAFPTMSSIRATLDSMKGPLIKFPSLAQPSPPQPIRLMTLQKVEDPPLPPKSIDNRVDVDYQSLFKASQPAAGEKGPIEIYPQVSLDHSMFEIAA